MALLQSNEDDSRTSNIIKVLYKAIHVVFSLDLGFFRQSSLKIRLIVNVFSIVKCATLAIGTLACVLINNGSIKVWFFGLLLEYLLVIIILACIKSDKTICNFYSELRQIDAKLFSNLYYIEFKTLLLILFCIFYRVIVTIFYCKISEKCVKPQPWATVIAVTLMISLKILLVCYTFLFYSVNCRLKTFSYMLETRMSGSDLVSLQHLYKSIVDVAEKYKAAFDLVYLVIVVFEVPRLMSTLYSAVEEVLDVRPVTRLVSTGRYALALDNLVITILPAFAAGLLSTQTEKIKVILHNYQFQQQGEVQATIGRFIRYVEARACRFRVYNVIPLNADLLGIVISFCATYLIVIIQFTYNF